MGSPAVNDTLIALGANLSHEDATPAEPLDRALAALAADPDISVAARSPLYLTPALPAGSGPEFVNAAARLETALAPEAVLDRLHAVEAALGRARQARWAPRACDLDLLAAGDAIRPDRETVARWMALPAEAAGATAPAQLILPHPRLQERAFVLVPLAEIAPDWRRPLTGEDLATLLARLTPADRAAVRPFTQA